MIKRALMCTTTLLSQKTTRTSSIANKIISPFLTANTPRNTMTMTKKEKMPAVLYHYPCPDGAFAALAAHLYFSASSTPALFFPNTVYSPLRPEDLPLDEIDHVYLLDFVGPSGFVDQLSSKVSRVIILDHHKTALESLGTEISVNGHSNVIKVIDMQRSGATIAYDYFTKKLSVGDGSNIGGDQPVKVAEYERVRRLFEYIEDADLWRWRLPNSKAFSSGLKDMNIEFDFRVNPSLFQQLLSLDVEDIISQGTASLAQKQKLIHDALEQSYEIALGGGAFGHCLAVNADSVAELRSELGHQLADKSQEMKLRGIGAVVYQVPELENDQLLKISLRSTKNEDTTEISKKFGGGGHRNASSFMLSSSEFEKWSDLGVMVYESLITQAVDSSIHLDQMQQLDRRI
ncbi:OLC1v1013873C1 [Oldenlandia corymbosa var. corymbosa]|uniref:OLC1v1013873C1 n=1 Tax=Oldenlandia corymbosa var. corymbosa TaxID=529605 RepID=A0AAV1DZJ8_OLDCO|nr:OLC1v1013873C1 [Oldenlandia corymbosa var. corymbosa]